MFLTKVKMAATLVLVVGGVAGAAVALTPPPAEPVAAEAKAAAPEPKGKGEDLAVPKDQRVDSARAAQVPVVLRVKWLGSGAAKAVASEEVEVLAVLKNTSGHVFGKTHWVGRANVPREKRAELPQEECTIYLQASANGRAPWLLLGLNLDQAGISHIGTKAKAGTGK